MKNWITVLLIFIIPIALYAYMDSRALSEMLCKIEGNNTVKNPKAKIIKFYSPMCSECQEMDIEMNKAMKNYKDSVLVEKINVIDDRGQNGSYVKNAIKKFKVKLVPTTVFLNKEGKTIHKQEGLIESDEIISILNGI